jgi:hypothetical protein
MSNSKIKRKFSVSWPMRSNFEESDPNTDINAILISGLFRTPGSPLAAKMVSQA